MPRIHVGQWADSAVSWAQTHLEGLFTAIGVVMGGLVHGLEAVLSGPAPWALAVMIAIVAWWARGPLFGVSAFAGLVLVNALGQWDAAMSTLALVLVASLAAIVVAVPIGILAARNRGLSTVVRPLLDLMQTMPAFVYLIPAIFFFGIGEVPGVIATMIFAIPPGVRLTELGIRQVDPETVEAARAFGSPPWRTLTRVQLPLALPTIMAGINQVIMLALSMVVIAGGPGAVVFRAITRLDVGAGVEGGLAVVVLAMLLDRLTTALGLRASGRTSRTSTQANRGTVVAQLMRPRAAFAVSGVAVLALVAGLMGSLTPTAATAGGNGKTITIGWIPWDEDVAVTHLYKKALQDRGYTVKLVQLDAGPVFAGMAQGDIDLFLDGWLPLTHEDYWKKYRSQLSDLGTWYDSAQLSVAVPTYAKEQSISDLTAASSQYDGRIVGIEPGSGLNRVLKADVLPGYGLSKSYELVEGSTPAMLAELKRSITAKKPVAVALWRPHWAYSSLPIRDLKDPKGLLGKPEQIHAIGRKGFAQDFPDVASMIAGFTLDDAKLSSLENLVINTYHEGEESQAVHEWLKTNPKGLQG